MNNKYISILRLTGLFLLFLLAMPAAALRVHAAFPYDIEEKNVIAYAAYPDDVLIYRDSSMEECKDIVSGEDFKMRIKEAKEDALYGNYRAGNHKGSGWISMDTVVMDPEFDHVYATVRDKMKIYTDSTCSKKRTTINKYTGVILIGKEGKGRQVIYDKGDYYGIGWMKRKSYANSLKYDGREKQILSDGPYHFQCGYEDDPSGGHGSWSETDSYPDHIFLINHVTGNRYMISDSKTGKYLQVKRKGTRYPSWTLTWQDEPSDIFGLFTFERIYGSFTIKNTLAESYYAQTKDGKDLLVKDPDKVNTHWRLLAVEKMATINDPFVFTQYDPKWCASPYGSEGCMGTAGCGILAPVNAVYALTGQFMDIRELADFAVDNHYRIEGSGTIEEVFRAIAVIYGRKYGFAWDGKSNKLKTLKKKLKEGKTAVVYVPGHYVSVTDYDEENDRYLMLDSNYLPKREDSPYGDWIPPERLQEGMLQSQGYYFYKLRKK